MIQVTMLLEMAIRLTPHGLSVIRKSRPKGPFPMGVRFAGTHAVYDGSLTFPSMMGQD